MHCPSSTRRLRCVAAAAAALYIGYMYASYAYCHSIDYKLSLGARCLPGLYDGDHDPVHGPHGLRAQPVRDLGPTGAVLGPAPRHGPHGSTRPHAETPPTRHAHSIDRRVSVGQSANLSMALSA